MIFLSPTLPPAERAFVEQRSKARAKNGECKISDALLPFCPGAVLGAAAAKAILKSKTNDESNKDTNPKTDIPEHKWDPNYLLT
ncbi:hypothetical protein IJE86_08575 [bacterium]|nr:hypothetical protein [bacterium]